MLTQSAERDLEEIHNYIAETDSPGTQITYWKTAGSGRNLGRLPGTRFLPERIAPLGIREYRQANFKPYRLVYRVIRKQVFIYMIADDRRDMQTLLTRRMLRV